MKIWFLLSLALVLASCNGDKKEDEAFGPYPGGKTSEKTQPK